MPLIDFFLERKPLFDYRPVRLALLRSSRRVFIERRPEFVAELAGDTVAQTVRTGVYSVVKDAVGRMR